MDGSIYEKLMRSHQASALQYHRLVLVVGEAGSGKTAILRYFAHELGTSVINVNLEIASELLDLTIRQRTIHLPKILEMIVSQSRSPVVLDNLEILFDKELRQDPLRLLKSISRNRIVVASWNGNITSGRLSFAETGHPEYRSYSSVDALIVGMDGTATVDSANNI